MHEWTHMHYTLQTNSPDEKPVVPDNIGFENIARMSIEKKGKGNLPTGRARAHQAARVGTYSSKTADSYPWFAASLSSQSLVHKSE